MLLAAAGLLGAGVAAAQAPVVEKVDPPGWWTGSTVNPVRLLIRGRNLAGASARCSGVQCGGVRVNPAGTYAFVDVTIPGATRPGRYPVTLVAASGSAEAPFEVSAPLLAEIQSRPDMRIDAQPHDPDFDRPLAADHQVDSQE